MCVCGCVCVRVCERERERERELSHNFGKLFNIIGELLTNCVLAILKDLVNFGEFWVILFHLVRLGSSNFGQIWCILLN